MRRPPALVAIALSVLHGVVLAGCGPSGGTLLEQSCRGERVLECDPYEYTTATSATLLPVLLSPGEPGARASVRIELDRCEPSPARASVAMSALVARSGGGVRVIDLGVSVADDGTGGDTTADDGIVEAMIGNPLGSDIPAEEAITLRFVPVVAGCTGDAIEIEYTTGPAFVPPGP